MTHFRRLSLLVALASLGGVLSACASGPPPPGEGLVMVTCDPQCRLTLNDEAHQPPAVVKDVQELSDAIASNVISLEEVFIEATPNGKTVVATRRSGSGYTGAPTGIWIWPDWRDAANFIYIPDFSEAEILSNYHIDLEHYPRDDVSAMGSRLIDWRNPAHRYHFEGFKLHLLRVADNGRWACPTRAGDLVVGWLDENDPNWVEKTIVVSLPGDQIDAESGGLLFRRSGEMLIMEVKTEHGNVVKSFRLANDSAIEIDSVPAFLYSHQSILHDDAFVITAPPNAKGVNKICEVAPDGTLAVIPLPWDRDGNEDPASESPSGKYIVTHRDTWIPGDVKAHIRRTPKAHRNDPLPSIPGDWTAWGTPRFWLSWEIGVQRASDMR